MGAPPRRAGGGPDTSDVTNPAGPPKPGRRAPAPSVHPEGAKPGDVIQGRWRYGLVRRLGKGGFGSVFLARTLDAEPGDPGAPPEQVAIKVLGRTKGAHARTSLKQELAALLSIQHERIPRLYDWCVDHDLSFAVLHYYPQGSLADAWPSIGRFGEEQSWRLLTDLLSALNAAHRASILHLDVKPSNVLIDDHGGFVLTDFGVAHASRMTKGLLHHGQLLVGLGTHGYRAPEQAERTYGSFDLRTDLWGVGATAWALYTGIDLNRRQDVLRHKEQGNIYGLKRLSDVRLHCPPPLEEVVMEMLYIDPARRPGGAAEVLTRIQAIAQGFGLDAQTVAASRREKADEGEIRGVVESLVDPLWSSVCRQQGFERFFVKFDDGEVIAGTGSPVHHTFLLLRGTVEIEREGRALDAESREGTFLCAVSTLTGVPREVTLRARGAVWCCIFNEAELEQLVTCNPAVAVRMIRTLAGRLAEGPPRKRGSA
jgi:serine/threonine protein kinase